MYISSHWGLIWNPPSSSSVLYAFATKEAHCHSWHLSNVDENDECAIWQQCGWILPLIPKRVTVQYSSWTTRSWIYLFEGREIEDENIPNFILTVNGRRVIRSIHLSSMISTGMRDMAKCLKTAMRLSDVTRICSVERWMANFCSVKDGRARRELSESGSMAAYRAYQEIELEESSL